MKYVRRPNKPFDTIRQMIEDAATDYGSSIAFQYKLSKTEVAQVSYEQFKENTNALGAALTAMGIRKTHVACYAENRYEYIEAYLTVLMSDSVFVPLDKDLPVHEAITAELKKRKGE